MMRRGENGRMKEKEKEKEKSLRLFAISHLAKATSSTKCPHLSFFANNASWTIE
jgi:hypothetical protein